jgi:hypothetical protein
VIEVGSADSAEEEDLVDSAEEEDSAVEEAKYSWKQKLLLSPKTKWLKSKTTHR